jgi:hypothetical protein
MKGEAEEEAEEEDESAGPKKLEDVEALEEGLVLVRSELIRSAEEENSKDGRMLLPEILNREGRFLTSLGSDSSIAARVVLVVLVVVGVAMEVVVGLCEWEESGNR